VLATGVAAYIVLLAAHARGLAGYWRTLGILDEPGGRAAVGLEPDEVAVGLIHLGYPLHPPQESERAPLAEVATRLD
jgi:nitroreductase